MVRKTEPVPTRPSARRRGRKGDFSERLRTRAAPEPTPATSPDLPGAIQQAVFEVIAAQVAVLDRTGKIIETNRAWKEAQGTAASATFLQAHDPLDYLQMWQRALAEGRDQAEEALALTRAVLNGERTGGTLRYCRGAALGGARWFQMTITALPNAQGAVVLHDDVSLEKRRESEILKVSERERRIISQDLHDGLCQHLGGVALLAKSLANGLARSERPEFEQARQLCELVYEAVGQTRAVARGLHPVEFEEAGGLLAALHELALQTNPRVPCELRTANRPTVTDNAVAGSLYRIAQEAVKNALQHAKPAKIIIQLRRTPAQLVLSVEDDGCGMPATTKARSMGMAMMTYWAHSIGGSLQVSRRPRGGTCLRCRVPAPKA